MENYQRLVYLYHYSAFGEDEFESWAWDKEFDANGNLIA